MANYVVSFLINQETQGISESYYYSAGNAEAVQNAALLLAKQRAQLLSQDCEFSAVRVSDVAIVGDSYLDTTPRSYQLLALPGDLSGSGIQVRLNSGGLYRRSFVIRGIPDEWIIRTAGGQRTYSSDGRAAAIKYCNYLRDNAWLLRITKKLADNPGSALVDVTTAALSVKLTTITSGFGTVGMAPGTKLQIRGCHNTARVLNGYWQTVGPVAVAGQVRINLVFDRVSGFNPADIQRGIVRPVEYDYLGITSGIPITVGTRKPGRAFFVPRGRQPNRPH